MISEPRLKPPRHNRNIVEGGGLLLNVECLLTVSFGSIFQTEGDGEHGVILKKLGGEGVPPQIVTILVEGGREGKQLIYKLETTKSEERF